MESKDEVIRAITLAWEKTQAQFEDLKRAVQKTEQMASLRTQAGSTLRELDRSLRDFGEAVWVAVKEGKVQLPANLEGLRKGVEESAEKKEALRSQIGDILEETVAVAPSATGQKPFLPRTGVTSKPKTG